MRARIEWECLANAGYNVGNQECIFANLLDIARLTQDIEIYCYYISKSFNRASFFPC